MSKLIFYPQSEVDSGLGHIRRCLGLASSFRQRGKLSEFFLNKGSPHIEFVRSRGFSTYVYQDLYIELNEYLSEGGVLVVDSYKFDWDMFYMVNREKTLIVVFDDLGNSDNLANIVINGSPSAKQITYNGKSGQEHLLGPDYQIIRDDLHKPVQQVIRIKPEKILTTLGSCEPEVGLEPFLEVLKNISIGNKGLTNDFVLGQDMKGPLNRNYRPIGFVNPEKLPSKLSSADIAIVSGGQSLIEVVYSGIPSVAVCTAKNQEKNIRSLLKLEVIYDYIDIGDSNWQVKLLNRVNSMIRDFSARQTISLRALKTFDEDGARRIVNRILEKSHCEN